MLLLHMNVSRFTGKHMMTDIAKPGTPKLQDTNKDGVITPADKVILGNFQPDMLLGMTNDFSWKKFDMSITLQSSLGSEIYYLDRLNYAGVQFFAMRRCFVENQWWSEQEPGDGKTPAGGLTSLTYVGSSDLYIENASFFFLRNLNIGYTLPAPLTRRIGISNLRAYTSMNNLLMIKDKNNHSYNPEGYTAGEIAGVNSRPGYNMVVSP